MIVKAIKTRKFLPPRDNLEQLLGQSIKSLRDRSIVAVTSKIVAIGEGRTIPLEKFPDKDELIIREADKYLPRSLAPNEWTMHTIKNNLLSAAAGIDESNALGHYILWPQDSQKSARKIWQMLRKKFKLDNLGVIITDSRLIPLRRGVVGISLGHFGFEPLKDYRGTPDLFGRQFRMETLNLPDSLASAAVLEMGEGAEQTPLAIITDIRGVNFTLRPVSDLKIDEKEDVFSPLIFSVNWKKGGSGKNQP